MQGKINKFTVFEDGSWLTLKIDYEIKIDKRKEEYRDVMAFKVNILDSNLRSFLKHSISSSKLKNNRGYILRNLLKKPIPLFERNDNKNSAKIKELMKSYLDNLKKQINLEERIKFLEGRINSKIYTFFDLSDDEIRYIESNFGSDSIILKLLLKN